jgi:hypothetical protein
MGETSSAGIMLPGNHARAGGRRPEVTLRKQAHGAPLPIGNACASHGSEVLSERSFESWNLNPAFGTAKAQRTQRKTRN